MSNERVLLRNMTKTSGLWLRIMHKTTQHVQQSSPRFATLPSSESMLHNMHKKWALALQHAQKSSPHFVACPKKRPPLRNIPNKRVHGSTCIRSGLRLRNMHNKVAPLRSMSNKAVPASQHFQQVGPRFATCTRSGLQLHNMHNKVVPAVQHVQQSSPRFATFPTNESMVQHA